jgi:hypothetical protein
MFIPNSPIGKTVVLKKNYETFGGVFTKGHKFKIIDDGIRGYDLQDDDGRRLLETGLMFNEYFEFVK